MVEMEGVTYDKDVDQSPNDGQDSAAKDEVVRPILFKVNLKIVSICHWCRMQVNPRKLASMLCKDVVFYLNL